METFYLNSFKLFAKFAKQFCQIPKKVSVMVSILSKAVILIL